MVKEGRLLAKTSARLKEWFKGYEEVPAWLAFCRLVFAVSILAFIVLFFGPALLSGNVLGFWLYQGWVFTYAGFPYIVITVAAFMIGTISGIPVFWFEWKRIKELKASGGR
jgi:hypothetical protein